MTTAPRIGDSVCLRFGYANTLEGILYRVDITKWGPTYVIKCENFEFQYANNLDLLDTSNSKIGAYYRPTSPLRKK